MQDIYLTYQGNDAVEFKDTIARPWSYDSADCSVYLIL